MTKSRHALDAVTIRLTTRGRMPRVRLGKGGKLPFLIESFSPSQTHQGLIRETRACKTKENVGGNTKH